MRRWTCAWVLVAVTACGSATGEPKTADEETLSEEPAEGAETEPSSEGSDTTSSESAEADTSSSSGAAESASETGSAADVTHVLQAMLDDPELDRHMQAGKAGRTPVQLSGPDLPSDLKLMKGGYPVKIVDAPKSNKDPVLVINRLEFDGNIATIAYRYDVEKIRGTTRIKKGSSGWELMSSRIMSQ